MQACYEYDRFTERTLTAEAAEKMGHVAWVEEKNPTKAIRAMIDGIKTKPYNCAVWTNAGDILSPGTKKIIKKWRQKNSLEIYSKLHPTGSYASPKDIPTLRELGFKSIEEAQLNLKKDFSNAATSPSQANKKLHQHMQKRLRQIFKAVAPSACSYQLRANENAYPSGVHNAHYDGFKDQIRLLEYIASETTRLIDNKDTSYRKPTEEEFRFHEKAYGAPVFPGLKETKNWFINKNTPITFWKVPENSMILITAESHHCKPIIHVEPTTPQNKKPQKRTVIAYDFCL